MPELTRALERGIQFLMDRQCPDGAWRSDTYGVFKEGDALTPLVLSALSSVGYQEEQPGYRRGVEFLCGFVGPDGQIQEGRFGLAYPVYTAALAVPVLRQWGSERALAAAEVWMSYLRARQLSEDLGWLPDDSHFGGWGYCHDLPRKPAPGEKPLAYTESNLSATAAALEAMWTEHRWTSAHPAVRRAQVFVQRCQNFCDDPAERDPEFDDGGFFFVQGDPQRNKAGVVGRDRQGRERYASYGSMTADGLRSLLLCGLASEQPRVQAALEWLGRHFSATIHPGRFPRERAAIRASVYFYYCWSLARALSNELLTGVSLPGKLAGWSGALAAALSDRQHADGSWLNDAVEVREDDPIVATALAAGTLGECQWS